MFDTFTKKCTRNYTAAYTINMLNGTNFTLNLVRILNFRHKILVLDNFSGISSDYMQEANAHGNLCVCTGSSELSLLANVISTKNNNCLFYLILYIPVNNF